MAALGIGDVELCSPAYAEFGGLSDAKQTRKILEDHGLECSSAHVTMEELRTRREPVIAWARDWPRIFAAAGTGGVRNYFLEQGWELTVQGVAYLKTLKA